MTETTPARRILIVEDEVMIAMLLEDMLADLGHEVVGPATRLEDGLALASTADFDMAVLDVNLNGVHSRPIADVLVRRGVPFVLATGYGAGAEEDIGEAQRVLKKPFTPEDLGQVLSELLRS
jgi:CheY-like chemotaxis protein